jgi:hypothetical protein
LAALAGRIGGYATGVDDAEVGVGGSGLDPTVAAKKRGDLLALIMVYLAAERHHGEGSHGADEYIGDEQPPASPGGMLRMRAPVFLENKAKKRYIY